jgi:hypothetical protein
VDADAVRAREQVERVVERRQLRRDLAQRVKALRAHPPGRRAVADLQQVVRVREDERAVLQLEHVELDEVAAEVDRARERAQGVLRLERRRALVADQ